VAIVVGRQFIDARRWFFCIADNWVIVGLKVWCLLQYISDMQGDFMSSLTLVIGNKNYSSWSLRPWVFLKQNGIVFNEVRVPLFVETSNDQLAQYNSDFKVPVLQDDDLLIWDSLSILEYLSENYLQSRGWPEDPQARAVARSVSCEMHSSFMNVRNELPMNCRKRFENVVLTAEAEREIERISALWQQCRSQYGGGGEWLFGNYSIADAMFAPIALRFYGYHISLGDVEASYVNNVLKQACIIEWVDAGKMESEIIAEDEIEV